MRSFGLSRDVGRVNVVAVVPRLVTFEALFGGIRDYWLCRVSSGPGLPPPPARRCVLLLVLQHDGGRLPRTFHVGAIGHVDDRQHSTCCGKQTKYPNHLSAGFGVSDHAHGKLSVFDRPPRWAKNDLIVPKERACTRRISTSMSTSRCAAMA